MKTRINLYVTELQPVKEKLPLSMSVTIVISVLVCSLMLCMSLYWLLGNEEKLQQQLRSELAQEQTQLASQARILSRVNNNKAIMEQIKQVTQNIKNKKRVLATLKHERANDSGFSSLLVSLAGISDQKVWLTKIKSQTGLLTFSGSAKRSQDIPLWVTRLSQIEELHGKTFNSLVMERDNSVINFVLHNKITMTTQEQ